jgi:hypothetical protein
LTTALVGRHFTLGRVIVRSGAVLWRTVPILLFVLVATGLPQLYVYAWSNARDPGAYWDRAWETSWPRFLSKLAIETANLAVFDALGSACILAAVLAALSGEAVSFRVILARTLRAWPIIAPITVLAALAWTVFYLQSGPITGGLGFVANLVMMTALWVYGPVVVAEQRGILDGIRRSLFLVSGNAWRIAVLVVLYVFTFFAMLYIAAYAFPAELMPEPDQADGGAISIGSLANLMLSEAATAVTAVCYVLLRNDKDGVPVAEIAPVFD